MKKHVKVNEKHLTYLQVGAIQYNSQLYIPYSRIYSLIYMKLQCGSWVVGRPFQV